MRTLVRSLVRPLFTCFSSRTASYDLKQSALHKKQSATFLLAMSIETVYSSRGDGHLGVSRRGVKRGRICNGKQTNSVKIGLQS